MAKQPYDVVKRFQEVAKRAKEVGPIHTGPKKFKKIESKPEPIDEEAYSTRPGRVKGPNSGKDVNLPIDTAPSNRKKKK